MAIGVAMLGFGASGTLLALLGPFSEDRAARWFVWAAVVTSLSLVVSPALVDRVRLDATQLAWNLEQWPRLALVYVLLALPFAAGALAVLTALAFESQRPGRVYGASFLGSGLGAALALAVLWWMFPARALAVPAVIASAGALAASRGGARSRFAAAGAAVVAAAAVGVLARPPWRLDVTPYKELTQVEAYPEARRVVERKHPLGWVVAVEAPAFRYMPGLSLAFRGSFPRQTALFVDGQIAGAAVAPAEAAGTALDVFDWLPSALPYALGDRPRVLIIGSGGGIEVWNALAHGARRVTAVELHPDLVAFSRRSLAARWTDGDRVEFVAGDARSSVARTREKFDVIALGPGGAFGTTAAGVHALDENFLHTQEAYREYLARLSDRGVLAVTRWLTVPPREIVRVILTAAEALRQMNPRALSRGLVVARSWGTATALVKPAGFTAAEMTALRTWAEERRFDLDWYPGIEAPAARFNLLDEPTLYRAAAAAAAGPEPAARFAAGYSFDVAPRSDARPYPHHFLRISSLGPLLRSGRGSWLPFAEWGLVALLATLAQSVVVAAVLLVVPAAIRSRAAAGGPSLPLIGYFTAIGVAYLAAEIAAIQQLGLLLGHPVYAVAAALAAFLACSGAGSAWSDRAWVAGRARFVGAVLGAVLVLYAAFLLRVVHLVQGAPIVVRGVVAVCALAPPAFLMGLPFPAGLRSLVGGDPVRLAWAWAANGFASVVAAPLAALIALEAGSPALFLVAALAYAVAAAVLATGEALDSRRSRALSPVGPSSGA